jgi:hypothetical protein
MINWSVAWRVPSLDERLIPDYLLIVIGIVTVVEIWPVGSRFSG